jgi:hypothetical protein
MKESNIIEQEYFIQDESLPVVVESAEPSVEDMERYETMLVQVNKHRAQYMFNNLKDEIYKSCYNSSSSEPTMVLGTRQFKHTDVFCRTVYDVPLKEYFSDVNIAVVPGDMMHFADNAIHTLAEDEETEEAEYEEA